MTISPFCTCPKTSSSVLSTAAAGTISQTTRGGLSLPTNSAMEEAAKAPVSFAKVSLVFAVAEYTITS